MGRSCFNPYRVFKFVATGHSVTCDEWYGICFNPYRVFKFVATYTGWHGSRDLVNSFNPYRVFKFVATLLNHLFPLNYLQFQSLSGFQVRCNMACPSRSQPAPSKFQSLSGFQVRCNFYLAIQGGLQGKVSIPIGFSSSLQRPFPDREEQPSRQVSIPIGFSSSLQPPAAWYTEGTISGFNPYRVFKFVATSMPVDSVTQVCRMFQSLSGFQVRCNVVPPIPNGSLPMVSIPIGFSSSLQRRRLLKQSAWRSCFNPYRVFKFVATS